MYLRRYRKLNKIKMETLAQQLGVATTAISKYESCDRFPRPELMHQIDILTKGQVTPNDFVSRWVTVHGAK